MYRSCSIRCRVTSTILLPLAMLGCDTPREVSSSRIQLQRPVAQLEVEALAAMPSVEEGEKLQPKLVDLSQLDPGLRFDIRYAGVAANAACDWPNAIRHSRSVRGGSTTSHHAIGAGRCEARGLALGVLQSAHLGR